MALCPPRALHPRPAPSRCSAPDAQEAIELELRTDSAEGLLLWHGAVSGGTRPGRPPRGGDRDVPTALTAPSYPQENGKAKDFVGLGLKDGHLVFR